MIEADRFGREADLMDLEAARLEHVSTGRSPEVIGHFLRNLEIEVNM